MILGPVHGLIVRVTGQIGIGQNGTDKCHGQMSQTKW